MHVDIINNNKTTLQQQQKTAAATPQDPHPLQQPFSELTPPTTTIQNGN
jgi:hypothetical protein